MDRSRAWYQASLRIQPGYVPALINLAANDHQLGDAADERAALRRVVTLQPTLPPALRADPVELAKRLIAAGDPATAVQVLDRLLRDDPTNLPAAFLRSLAMHP